MDSSKSLTTIYRELGEDINSSALIAELSRMRNYRPIEDTFSLTMRDSHPCAENQMATQSSVAFLQRPCLYLPSIQYFSDIQKTDFSHIQNVLDALLVSGIECCVTDQGDGYIKDYIAQKDVIFSEIQSLYNVKVQSEAVIRLESYGSKRKRMLNLHLAFTVGVCDEGAFVRTKLTVPTRYKSFYVYFYELNNRFYLSIPKESTETIHPENETFVFEGASSQENIHEMIKKRYKHRVFYANYKKMFDKHFNDDIQLENIDLWSTIQIVDAIKM